MLDQQAKQPPFLHQGPLRGGLFHGMVRCVLAGVIMAGSAVFVTTSGWCDEPEPAVSRGGILALPPLRALIGVSDPPSYDAKVVRHIPNDVAAEESSASKSRSPKAGSSTSSNVQKKGSLKNADAKKPKSLKTVRSGVNPAKTDQQKLPPLSQVRAVPQVKVIPAIQKASGQLDEALPVVVSSSPHSQISPPLLALSAEDPNTSYRQALDAAAPQVARHDLRSLVSLSDLETVVVSSRGVNVYSPYEQPVHKGLARAISFGGPHTNRSVLVATIQYAHNSDHVSVEDRRLLEQVALLHGQNGGRVRVVGHASSKAAARREHVNLDISRRRAQKVASALRDMGIPRSQLQIAATADWNPRYNEGTSAGEAGNRRTEIWFDF